MKHWPGESFHNHCLARGLAETSARYYASYLRKIDKIVGGLDALIGHLDSHQAVDDHVCGLPINLFKSQKVKGNAVSTLRMYLDFRQSPQMEVFARPKPANQVAALAVVTAEAFMDVDDLFHDIRSLAARYYRSMGKHLGVTGELAELAVAQLLSVELAPPRTAGFDGWLVRDGVRLRVQIKGRAVPWARRYGGRCPSIKCRDLFDIVLLVLIDNQTMQPREIWEAPEAEVARRLAVPGSKSRNERSSMGLSQFKSIARLVWSA